MTDDPVALGEWYPVADAADAPAHTTRLLGHPLRVSFAGDRTRITALSPEGRELRELPTTERFGLVWTTLGTPAREVYDFPEAHEPGRRYLRCGWVTLRTSAPRIVENFLDPAHFPYVHPGGPGDRADTAAAGCEAEIRPGPDEVWATSGQLTYRVPSPFQVMCYRFCPAAPERRDAILLAVHPVDEHRCRAQPVAYLVDDRSADNDLRSIEQALFLQDRFIVENQRPLSLPLSPGREVSVPADAASLAYRRWLRDKGLTFGVLA
jgi:phenylpropionate dioxygenase-like ring-hydroxylating dioxygenase large terminal subunit